MAERSVKILKADAICSRPGIPLADEDALSLTGAIASRFADAPEGTWLYFATTVGAIELLERGECDRTSEMLLEKVASSGRFGRTAMVSAACAGGQQAVAAAVRAIRSGRCRSALVVAVDGKSEFVESGFTSLGAVSQTVMRPYDEGRDGLRLGGGAGAILLAAGDCGDADTPCIAGIGSSCDAAHITAPDLSGRFLALAIRRALEDAGLEPGDIGGIIGHGTGTMHNDAAEVAALNEVFSGMSVPLVSVKAFTGHTLAATGAIQIACAVEYLRDGMMPGQVALEKPMAGAERFVSTLPRELASRAVLSLNAGFGGLNSAVVVKGGE